MGFLRDKVIVIIVKEMIIIVLVHASKRYPIKLFLFLLVGGIMRKVAIYCRTSTSMQQTGLESQKRALIEFCRKNEINEYVIYEDEGVSGTKKERPALNKLMTEVIGGNIQKAKRFQHLFT